VYSVVGFCSSENRPIGRTEEKDTTARSKSDHGIHGENGIHRKKDLLKNWIARKAKKLKFAELYNSGKTIGSFYASKTPETFSNFTGDMMKRFFFLAAMFAAFSIAGFAQKPTDFSGTWSLDIPKSQLDARMKVDALTMTVAQTDKELKVTTETKRPAPPADAPAGPNGQGSGRGMRGFGGGDGTVAYSLDGKETTVEVDGPNGKLPIKYKASVETGKASLSSSRSFTGQMGEITVTTKDSWTLSADGKTLTDVRETTSPRGTSSSTLVFEKK
jgi:hypothetical protein